MRQRLLVVDDDAGIRKVMRHHFARRGYDVDCAAQVGEANALLSQSRYGAVVVDLQLTPGEGSEGFAVVVEARRRWPGTRVVLLTGQTSDVVEVAARRLGVDAVLGKESSLSDVEAVIRRLVEEVA